MSETFLIVDDSSTQLSDQWSKTTVVDLPNIWIEGLQAKKVRRVDWATTDLEKYEPTDRVITELRLSARHLSWVEFYKDVLPYAEAIEFLPPDLGNYAGLIAERTSPSKPYLYLYQQGSTNNRWGLKLFKYTRVCSIHGIDGQISGVFFSLAGMTDNQFLNEPIFSIPLGVEEVYDPCSSNEKVKNPTNGYLITPSQTNLILRVTEGVTKQVYLINSFFTN